MSTKPCNADECTRTVLARGMCSTHYSYWHRENNQHELTCQACGKHYTNSRAESTVCSVKCASAKAAEARPPAKPRAKPVLKTPAEMQAMWASRRSEFRASFEDGRWDDFLRELRERVAVTPEGCWDWQGQTRTPTKSASPYPVLRWAGKSHQVHRLSLEAKHGKPLGTQHAHHTCANTRCVNPDHMQAATHAENAAEMKARRSYELRIAELEAALRSVDPNHEALNRISYGQTG